MIETLLQALTVLEKCLNYDWTAFLCNETLDQQGQTNVPISWRGIILVPDLVQHLFNLISTEIHSSASAEIKTKCALCLQHLAYVRHAIFETQESRFAFLQNFMTEITKLIESHIFEKYVLAERQLFKEVVKIITKL